MKLTSACFAILLLAAVATRPAVAQEPAPGTLTPDVVNEKPKPCVTFAKSWEAAIEEAKLLNVPIVVHSHGFY